ncbi:MAG: mitochondrial fission ELM1 family protein, partial [Akkermansiaceae bacterium]|nr:mitochondrial fission ELM1 family protein [Akkermansiaceae bacterium]
MKALWIKDSKAGHLSKARGLLMAMGERINLEVIEYYLEWRWPVLRQPLSWLGSAGLQLDFRWFVKGMPALDGIDFVISAGGATQWLNAAVARRCSVGNVFLGSPRSMDPQRFSLIASHDSPEGVERFFRFDLIPSGVTRKLASAAAVDAGCRVGTDIGLLIGGDGEGIRWHTADYLSMGSKLISLARENGVGAWIATSRRTPAAVEADLRAMLDEA